jgi:hypothetical protein
MLSDAAENAMLSIATNVKSSIQKYIKITKLFKLIKILMNYLLDSAKKMITKKDYITIVKTIIPFAVLLVSERLKLENMVNIMIVMYVI